MRVSPRENHRERLLDGALQCLRTKGYARTTARDIAAAASSNLGSIGYHFGSKEALLNEAIRVGFAGWVDRLEELAFAEPTATPLERVQAAWIGLTDTFAEYRALMTAFIEALAQADRSSDVRDQRAELYEETRSTVARMLRASIGDAELAEDHVRGFVSALCAVADGLLLQWLVDPERTPSAQEVIGGLQAALPLALTNATVRSPATDR